MYKAKKSLGQNFLMEFSTSQRMVDALELEPNDLIVEIGPGLGALTEILVERSSEVNAVVNAIEIDPRFFHELENILGNRKHVNLINDDILKWLPNFFPGRSFKLLGSIPYYITSPILHEVVKHKGDVEICVFLVQKEVAQKIVSLSPSASYLSTFINTFFSTTILENVPREFFKPVPNVDSAVIRLKKIKKPAVSFDQSTQYEDFLHKGFSKPRKMLNKVFDKEFLMKHGVDYKLRPQHLPIDKWVELFTSQLSQ